MPPCAKVHVGASRRLKVAMKATIIICSLSFSAPPLLFRYLVSKMQSHEIIDLSLSTDDEGQAQQLLSPKIVNNAQLKSTTDFLLLSDDFDSNIHIGISTPGQAHKRRKLNSKHDCSEYLVGSVTPIDQQNTLPPTRLSTIALKAKRRGKKAAVDCEPILSISSPNDTSISPHKNRPAFNPISCYDDDFDDNAVERPCQVDSQSQPGNPLSNRTATLLAEISANSRHPVRQKSALKSKKTASIEGQGTCVSKVESRPIQRRGKPTTSRTRLTSAERDIKDQEKEREKAKKAQDKEGEKERKQKLKDERAREKQIAADLAEVNKAKTDKKISIQEMIVDLPLSIEGQSVDTQVREILRGLEVPITTYNGTTPNIIKWRRKVVSRYNEEMGYWEPSPEVILPEKHIMCLLSAKDFVAMAGTDPAKTDSKDLETHVLRLKADFEDSKPIYMIEGLGQWMRKNKNTRNRAYQAAILSQIEPTHTDDLLQQRSEPNAARHKATKKRGKKSVEEYVDEDMVEDALLRLQVMHGCLVHHTSASIETAEWIATFTENISQIPFK